MTKEIFGILTILVGIFLVFSLTGHRSLFRSTRQDIKATAQDFGADIKATGRNAADSIRRTLQ